MRSVSALQLVQRGTALSVWSYRVKTTTGVLKFCTGVLCKTLSIRREFVHISLAPALLELYPFFPRLAQRLTTGWTVRGSNPGGGEILWTCPDWPWGPLSHLYSWYLVSFLGLTL